MTSACVEMARANPNSGANNKMTRFIRANSNNAGSRGFMTKVIGRTALLMSLITLGVPPIAQAQSAPALARPTVDLSPSIEELYAQLQQVGLDEHRVYKVRNLAFDRAAFHISLEDGVIGFTQDVLGKVT